VNIPMSIESFVTELTGLVGELKQGVAERREARARDGEAREKLMDSVVGEMKQDVAERREARARDGEAREKLMDSVTKCLPTVVALLTAKRGDPVPAPNGLLMFFQSLDQEQVAKLLNILRPDQQIMIGSIMSAALDDEPSPVPSPSPA